MMEVSESRSDTKIVLASGPKREEIFCIAAYVNSWQQRDSSTNSLCHWKIGTGTESTTQLPRIHGLPSIVRLLHYLDQPTDDPHRLLPLLVLRASLLPSYGKVT
jgi:hypothetical protein